MSSLPSTWCQRRPSQYSISRSVPPRRFRSARTTLKDSSSTSPLQYRRLLFAG
nr:hypothetical protein [Streptomyces cavourensis]